MTVPFGPRVIFYLERGLSVARIKSFTGAVCMSGPTLY